MTNPILIEAIQQAVQQTIQPVLNRLIAIEDSIENLDNRLSIKIQNSSALHSEDVLYQLRLRNGDLPGALFPANQGELRDFSSDR